jgi:hypothetical protein
MEQRAEILELGSVNAECGIIRLRNWDFGFLIGRGRRQRDLISEWGIRNEIKRSRNWEAEGSRLKAQSSREKLRASAAKKDMGQREVEVGKRGRRKECEK